MSTMTPDRALTQRRDALERANHVRLNRAAMKRDLAAGRVSITDVLADPPDYTLSLPIGELLASQRGWGAFRVQRFLKAVEMTATKRLGSLTERQRDLLADMLR